MPVLHRVVLKNIIQPYNHNGVIDGKHHYFREPLDKFNKTIEEFVAKIEFDNEFREKFNKVYLSEWENREKQVSNQVVIFNKQLVQIEEEIHSIKETIKRLSSPTTIKLMEEDIEKLEVERASLTIKRVKKEDEQISIQVLLNYANYYLEHLEFLLLDWDKPQQVTILFELLFDELPTYEDIILRTVNLAPIFKLNEQYKQTKSLSVTPLEFESRFAG